MIAKASFDEMNQPPTDVTICRPDGLPLLKYGYLDGKPLFKLFDLAGVPIVELCTQRPEVPFLLLRGHDGRVQIGIEYRLDNVIVWTFDRQERPTHFLGPFVGGSEFAPPVDVGGQQTPPQ